MFKNCKIQMTRHNYKLQMIRVIGGYLRVTVVGMYVHIGTIVEKKNNLVLLRGKIYHNYRWA